MVRVLVKPDAVLELADAEASVEASVTVLQEAGGSKRPILVDMRHLKSMSRQSRVYYAGPDPPKHYTAVALIIASPLTRAIGNFFMGLNKPRIPIRLFTSEVDAAAWAKGIPG